MFTTTVIKYSRPVKLDKFEL